MPLTNKALVDQIAQSADLDPKLVRKTLLHTVRIITAHLANGDSVTLPDLGRLVNQGGVVVFVPSPTLKTHLLP